MAKNIWPQLRRWAEKRLLTKDWTKSGFLPTSPAGMALEPYMRSGLVHRAELYKQGPDAWGVNIHFKEEGLPVGVRPIIGTPTLSPAETQVEAFEQGVVMAMLILTNDKRVSGA